MGRAGIDVLRVKYPTHLQSLILVNTTPASSTIAEFIFFRMSSRTTKEDSVAQLLIAETEGFKKREPATMAKFFRLLFRSSFHNKKYSDSLTLIFDSSYAAKSVMVRQLSRDSTLRVYDIHARLDTGSDVLPSSSEDPTMPWFPAPNEQIRDHLRGSEYVLLPEYGHFPFIESQDSSSPL